MTREHTSALLGATARAMAEGRNLHCPAPAYRPAAAVRASTRYPKCCGLLTYTASSIDGRTTGRCSSAGCINWSEL